MEDPNDRERPAIPAINTIRHTDESSPARGPPPRGDVARLSTASSAAPRRRRRVRRLDEDIRLYWTTAASERNIAVRHRTGPSTAHCTYASQDARTHVSPARAHVYSGAEAPMLSVSTAYTLGGCVFVCSSGQVQTSSYSLWSHCDPFLIRYRIPDVAWLGVERKLERCAVRYRPRLQQLHGETLVRTNDAVGSRYRCMPRFRTVGQTNMGHRIRTETGFM
jgi:hypothetical protein